MGSEVLVRSPSHFAPVSKKPTASSNIGCSEVALCAPGLEGGLHSHEDDVSVLSNNFSPLSRDSSRQRTVFSRSVPNQHNHAPNR